ncbi:putative HVA22-like protein g isoform X1 [Fagus crenata]
MLGDFITRCLVLVLGYAYPAFECYKVVEKNRVEIQELRFWCQYWIIVALLTVLERIGDIFISWVPMYGELKLALFIYLWYPTTKGSGFVYNAVLRPYVTKNETVIERKLQEWRARAWDLAIYYWQNCSQLGQSAFFEVLQRLASQSTRFTHPNTAKSDNNNSSPPPNRFPPSAPPMPGSTVDHAVAEPPKSDAIKFLLHQTEHVNRYPEPGPADSPENHFSQRLKFRRSKPQH